MSDAVWTVIASFIGASAGIVGGTSLESYKRFRDRGMLATVLAASIGHYAESLQNGTILDLKEIIAKIYAGEVFSRMPQTDVTSMDTAIIDQNVERLGSLPTATVKSIIKIKTCADTASSLSDSIRIFDKTTIKNVETVVLKYETVVSLAPAVIHDLNCLAAERFWSRRHASAVRNKPPKSAPNT